MAADVQTGFRLVLVCFARLPPPSSDSSDTKWLGALIGAVTGMIVGVLLVGAAMALLGTKVEELSLIHI